MRNNSNSLNQQNYKREQQILYIDKLRPPIFTQSYNYAHKKKIFQDIYDSPVFKQLSFLINDQPQACNCLDSINECPKIKDIVKESKRNETKIIFQRLKSNTNNSKTNRQQINDKFDLQVLEPHYFNLIKVLALDNYQAIIQILKHTKKDYLTFWIYGLLCAKIPAYNIIQQNIMKISQKMNLALDLEVLTRSDQNSLLKYTYKSKLVNLFPQDFASVVNLIIKSQAQQMIVQKLIICHFIKGRARKQFQVIKAALQL